MGKIGADHRALPRHRLQQHARPEVRRILKKLTEGGGDVLYRLVRRRLFRKSRVEHDVRYPQLVAPFGLLTEGPPAFREHLRVRGADVYQIRGVGDDRLHRRSLPGAVKILRLLQ
ncbi:hypothetical protein SDC9_164682 [bioreactor metagenome]|uniref:Uncharacterized protein n=1 Tax=bioreactor metagenome TaxID=1076179 RepID=A0A645FUX9_9ZZZZ